MPELHWREVSFGLDIKDIATKYSCSYQDINKIDKINPFFSYVFLTPLYPRNNEAKLNKEFSENIVKKTLSLVNIPIYAMGGIKQSHFEQIKRMNFNGVALQGSIWYENQQPLNCFIEAKKTLNKI